MNWFQVSTITASFVIAILALCFLIIYRLYPTVKPAKYWFVSFLLFSVSLFLASFRMIDGTPVMPIILIANIAIILAFTSDYIGVCDWVKKRSTFKKRMLVVIVSSALIGYSYCIFYIESVTPRLVITRLFYASICLCCFFCILRARTPLNIGHKAAAFFLLLHSVVYFSTIYLLLTVDSSSASVSSQTFQNLASTKLLFLIFPLLFMGTGIFYLLGLLLTLLEIERDLVVHDDLTTLHNRRGLENAFKIEINRSRKNDIPLCMAMIDLDHFKKVNDQYGHRVGDQVLQEFAQRVSQEIRNFDVFARVGGEEFTLLLIDTPINEAYQIIQRIRNTLIETRFTSHDVKCTASFGLTVFNAKTDSKDMLYKRADELLYQAKKAGRNTIVVK